MYTHKHTHTAGGMSFLESVFSVLFGDGDPNADLEERRSKAVAKLIRAKGGAVTAEELAPYMDPDTGILYL